MPAEHENIVDAQAEGIEIVPLTLPVNIKGKKVQMTRTELIDGKPLPVKGTEFEVDLDKVVIAIGQSPDPHFLQGSVVFGKDGLIKVKRGQTSESKIFACGDVVISARGTVAHAVGQGLKVAEAIDLKLRGIPRFWASLLKRNYFPDVKIISTSNSPRLTIPTRAVDKRICDLNQVELPSSAEVIQEEASRCLTCPLRYRQ